MNIFRCLTALYFLLGVIPRISGQNNGIPIPYATAGSIYRQNFDSLPVSGTFTFTGKGPFWVDKAPLNANQLNGWQLLQITGSKLNFSPGTGSGTGNAIYSLGSSGSTDRTLGSLSTSTGIYSFGVLLTNQTGQFLNSISIRFTAEQWRKGGSGNRNTWTFYYKTGNCSTIDESDLLFDSIGNFNSPVATTGAGALNGNLPENQQTVSFQLENLLWKPGEQLLLRWNDADETGNDDAMGIDNFQLSAILSPQSPVISQEQVSQLSATTAKLSCQINEHLSLTHILTEFASDSLFSHPEIAFTKPDTLEPGSGNHRIEAMLTMLNPHTNYYARLIAANASGSDTSSILSFQTPVGLPIVNTLISEILSHSANMGGKITATGGGAILDKGVLWSVDKLHLINQIGIPLNSDSFLIKVTGLPSATILYATAYVTNKGGTAYGDTVTFRTPGTVISLSAKLPGLTRDSVVSFTLKLSGPITGFNPSNFSINQNIPIHAYITRIQQMDSTYNILINTGSGDGKIGLALATDSGLSARISNLPFFSGDTIRVDKTPVMIQKITLPDTAAKIGDTLSILLKINPDPDPIAGFEGWIDSLPIFDLQRLSDSLYQANCLVREGGRDFTNRDSIPVRIQLTDSAGNLTNYVYKILPDSFSIDSHYPLITNLKHPKPGWYKNGDSLEWIIRFSEPVFMDPRDPPLLTFTMGTRSRSAMYSFGNRTDSLVLKYAIQSGDKDLDGISTGKGLVTTKSSVQDYSGNPAKLNFVNQPAGESIKIDAVEPVIQNVSVPHSGKYFTGDSIGFQLQFSKSVFLRTGIEKPVLAIRIGNAIRFATYHHGTGTQTLEFRYQIQANDTDTLGCKIMSPLIDTALSLMDSLGNPIEPVLHNIGSTSGIQINPSTIQLLETLLPAAGLYHYGDVLSFAVSYNESAFISGTTNLPSIKIRIGKNTRYATYTSGSGSRVLSFSYQIQKEDEDSMGIMISPFLILNSGGIKDNKGYFAPFVISNGEWATAIKVDAVFPEITNIQLPDAGMYRSGDSISMRIHFSEKVLIAASANKPRIKMTIGSNTRYLTYLSGTGSQQLLFTYSIINGDLDKNGIRLFANILADKNQLTDLAGNPADLSFNLGSSLPRITIDGIAPVFSTDKSDTIQLCENQVPYLITDLFAVTDEEAGELISWRMLNKPVLGTLSNYTASIPSNGKIVLPAGWFYQPLPGQHGWDSLVTEITDGIYSTQKTIRIQILPAIRNNHIRNPQTLCMDQQPEKLFGSQPTGGSGNYQYVWESANDKEAAFFQKAEKNNGDADYSPVPLAGTTWFRRILFSGACKDSSEPVKINIFKEGYWKGDSSQNWEDPHNWCQSRIPSDTTDVYIDSVRKYNPVISSQVVCRDLILTAKSHLTIEGNLQIKGLLRVAENSIDAAKGSLSFRSTATQYLSGNVFYQNRLKNFFIQTPGHLHLTDSLTLTGTMYVQKGNLYTHDFLTLSDSATIAPVATGSDIIGKTHLKIRIPEGKSIDRILAHPFSHPISLLSLTDSIDITGEMGSLHGFSPNSSNSPSAFWYDPEKGTEESGFDSGWQAFTNLIASPANQWKKQTGIRLWIRGKKGQGLDGSSPGNGTNGGYFPAAVSLFLSGQLNTGDQEVQIPVNQSPAYQIMGNPYVAAINLASISRTEKTGNAFWIWNPLQGRRGGYSCYLFSQPYLLPPFGSFIVKAIEAPFQHFLITENCKTELPVNDSLQFGEWNDVLGCEIRLVSDQIFWDRILIRQLDSARSGQDKFDAEKIINPDLNFFTRNKEGRMLSIDSRNLANQSTIQLGITQALPGRYQLKIAMSRLPVNNTLQLYDNYLHQWIPLNQDETYSFDITSDTATQGMNRFEIKSPVDPDINLPDKHIQLTVFPVPARDQLIVNFHCSEPGNTSIRILHLSGNPMLQKELGIQESGQIRLPVAQLISGMYLLEFRSGQHVLTRKFYKH